MRCVLHLCWLSALEVHQRTHSRALQVAKRLFDVDIVPADGEVPVWHPDVRFFKVMQNSSPRAYFYLDPYSRPAEKRGGAWMAEVKAQAYLCFCSARQ